MHKPKHMKIFRSPIKEEFLLGLAFAGLLGVILYGSVCFLNDYSFSSEADVDLSSIKAKETLTNVEYETLSKYLQMHDIPVNASALASMDDGTNEGDLICSLISRSMSVTGANKCIIKLTSQHLKGLPKNCLIKTQDELLILDHVTDQSVYFWGIHPQTVLIKPYASFEKTCRTQKTTMYILLDRGYDLK